MVCVHYGLGRHEADLTAEQISSARLVSMFLYLQFPQQTTALYFQLTQVLSYWWVCEMAYGPAITFSRISIGILFLRLIVDRIQRYLIHMVNLSSAGMGIGFVLLFALQCRPVSFYWNTEQDGSCINPRTIVIMTYIASATALICDL
jgi:hypothetical protein